MKRIIRTIIYSGLSLYSAQLLIGSFSYSENKTAYLTVLGVSILYFFLKPIISVVSLPTKGSVFFLISFISTGIVFYALASILSDLGFQPTTLQSLNIFGRVLPSKDLDSLGAMIFSAFVTSAVYLFLESLCGRKK